MRQLFRRTAMVILTSTLATAALGQEPGTPGTPPPPALSPLPAPAAAAPEQRPAGVAATVNGQEVPEVAVYRALRQFPPAERDLARKEILNHLIENIIIDQYLNAIKITVEPTEVDKLINEIKDELKKGQKDYQKELEAMMLTEAEFRAEVMAQMKWDKFLKQQGTDEALKKLFEQSPTTFDGSLVRCRHILMTPTTDPAKQEEARQTLLAIKKTIEQEVAKAGAGEADPQAQTKAKAARTEELFGEYAKKYSTCPSKANGGDLNFFPRVGAMVEPFSAAAFQLNQHQMSDVVNTEFGMHLILCTDKKPGTQRKFEDVKEDVLAVYAIRLREAVVNMMKPKAQIAYPNATQGN